MRMRALAVLGAALTLSCRRPSNPRQARAADATSSSRDASTTRARSADATAGDAATDVPEVRSPLELFVVGGTELMRPGGSVQLRVIRSGPGVPQPFDATSAVVFHVYPSNTGNVDEHGTFHGGEPGRADITAHQGDAVAHVIVEVTTELPLGTVSLPTLNVGAGRVVRGVHFFLLRDGNVGLDVQADGLSLALRGPLHGRALPLTIPVRDVAAATSNDAGPGTVGTIQLLRWSDRRLDGRATLQTPDGPQTLVFSVMFPDLARLFARSAP